MTSFTLTASPHWHRMVALVSLTVATLIRYTAASCPKCGKLLYLAPGERTIITRAILRLEDGHGHGRLLKCKGCKTLSEVLEFAA